jgi:thioredoxin-like negative regulator of GroEL
VSNLTFVALWCLAAGADDPDTYAKAHEDTMKTGKPMVVMVTTDWCAPCQVMKKTIIPQVRERGLLRRVAFAVVNPDRERDLAQKLTGGGPVPQLLLFRKTREGWQRKALVGGQSVEAVEQLITEAVAKDEPDSKKEEPKAGRAKEAPASDDHAQSSEKQSPQEHHVAAAHPEKNSGEAAPEQSNAQ